MDFVLKLGIAPHVPPFFMHILHHHPLEVFNLAQLRHIRKVFLAGYELHVRIIQQLQSFTRVMGSYELWPEQIFSARVVML